MKLSEGKPDPGMSLVSPDELLDDQLLWPCAPMQHRMLVRLCMLVMQGSAARHGKGVDIMCGDVVVWPEGEQDSGLGLV